MASRVSILTEFLPLITAETVPIETPARLATSVIVTFLTLGSQSIIGKHPKKRLDFLKKVPIFIKAFQSPGNSFNLEYLFRKIKWPVLLAGEVRLRWYAGISLSFEIVLCPWEASRWSAR
jgi:hypothetical protein